MYEKAFGSEKSKCASVLPGKGERPSQLAWSTCMPKIGCWKERKQFEDERACDSWAAYGQGWEDVTRQVYATTAVGAICVCKEWQDGVRVEIQGKCWEQEQGKGWA